MHDEAARQVLRRDCLVRLGTCVAPVGPSVRAGSPVASVQWTERDGPRREIRLGAGELVRVPLAAGAQAHLCVRPARGFDAGAGPGAVLETDVDGGEVGVILDARGRPLALAADEPGRLAQLRRWRAALDLYPEASA